MYLNQDLCPHDRCKGIYDSSSLVSPSRNAHHLSGHVALEVNPIIRVWKTFKYMGPTHCPIFYFCAQVWMMIRSRMKQWPTIPSTYTYLYTIFHVSTGCVHVTMWPSLQHSCLSTAALHPPPPLPAYLNCRWFWPIFHRFNFYLKFLKGLFQIDCLFPLDEHEVDISVNTCMLMSFTCSFPN